MILQDQIHFLRIRIESISVSRPQEMILQNLEKKREENNNKTFAFNIKVGWAGGRQQRQKQTQINSKKEALDSKKEEHFQFNKSLEINNIQLNTLQKDLESLKNDVLFSSTYCL